MTKRQPPTIKFLAILLLAGLSGQMAFASSLREALDSISNYGWRQLERAEDWRQRESLGPFPRPILEEFTLLNLTLWEARRRGGGAVRLEAFEMLDPQGAFGLFTERQEQWSSGEKPRRLDLTVDNLLREGRLALWRGRYFFELSATEDVAPDQLELVARVLVEQIDEINLYPMTVVQLPDEDLIRESIRFYLGPTSLSANPEFPAPLLDKLGFEDEAEVTFARYRPRGDALFLIGYPTADVAELYVAQLQKELGSVFSREGIYVKRSGLLVSLFQGPEAEARRILDRVRYTATVKWIYEKEAEPIDRRGEIVTFFGIVTSSILFTGAFIVVVMFLGLLTGLVRYGLIRRYPVLAAGDKMVRLGLDDIARRPSAARAGNAEARVDPWLQ